MKPNIDRTGRIARAISGVLFIGFAVASWLTGWPESIAVRWGIDARRRAFSNLYEAKAGWCVLRACGLKTPL